MRPRHPFPSGTTERTEALLESADSLSLVRRLQTILLRSKHDMSLKDISNITGFKQSTVRKLHHEYLQHGAAIFDLKDKGGRHNSYMDEEEEAAFLLRFESSGKKGGVLELSKIHAAHKANVGENIALSTTYRMLQRNGWRKLAPRPRHPSGNNEAIEHFKKTSGGWYRPQEGGLN